MLSRIGRHVLVSRQEHLRVVKKELPSGFRMPAEWEPHHATWIAWPHNREDWPGKFTPIRWVYVEIVRHLQGGERVCILVENSQIARRIRHTLSRAAVDLEQVDFYAFPTDRVWTRDYGPIFIKKENRRNTEIAIINWRFNAWAKYSNWKKDNQIPAKISTALGLRQWEPIIETASGGKRVVLEGGSIDINGFGTLLTTEECLLSTTQQRNPGMSKEDIEVVLHDYLGIRNVLWLGQGIAGDDTHGHIDDLARFVNPTTIVTVVEENPADANYRPLQENLHRLKQMRDQNGQSLSIVPLPMPRPLYFGGQRLPASYANFYIGNRVVLVPTFNDPNDRVALSVLSNLFPDREVVGIHSVDLVWGFGALHCLTQQQPR
jgi:agmatine deiminase